MSEAGHGPGRKAQAARNDERILAAARSAVVADPAASMHDIARAAGVGISALYRRFANKDDLLRALCADGLERYIAVAERVRAAHDDPGERFDAFLRGLVEENTSSLTVRLAGTFEPAEPLGRLATRAGEHNVAIFDAAQRAGAVRPDAVVNDLAMLLEALASLGLGPDPDRSLQLRRRYLEVALAGLRVHDGPSLPDGAPTDEELGARWEPRPARRRRRG